MPGTILKPYYFMFRNRFRFREELRHSMQRDALILVVTGIIMFCIFLGFTIILNSLEKNPLVRQLIPTKIIELLFYAFFCLLVVTNTIAATGNIFSAQNMDLLLATPVSALRLYIAKLFEMLAETSLMFVIFIVPVGAAYSYSLQLQPGLLLTGLAVAVPFLLIPAGVSVVIATAFVRFAALIWRRGLFFMVCVFGIGVYAVVRLLEMLRQVHLQKGGANAIVQMIGLFDNPSPTWLPSRWAADLLAFHVTGSVQDKDLKLQLLWICAAASLAIGYLAFDFLLLPVRSAAVTHERREGGSRKTGPANDIFRFFLESIYLRLPIDVQFRAIILKDLTSVVRDRAQSLQLLLYLGIALVSLIILEFMSKGLTHMSPVAQQAWWAFLSSCNVLFTGFVTTALMTRLVYPSISLEGKAFWILITAPIDRTRLILAKFFCWLPLIVIISCSLLAAGILAIHFTWLMFAASLYVGLCLSIGCTGLALGIGGIFASFEWESPTQIASGFGTLVLLLCSLALVVGTFLPASGLMFLCGVTATRNIVGPALAPYAGALLCLLIFALNAGVAGYCCLRGAQSLEERNLGR